MLGTYSLLVLNTLTLHLEDVPQAQSWTLMLPLMSLQLVQLLDDAYQIRQGLIMAFPRHCLALQLVEISYYYIFQNYIFKSFKAVKKADLPKYKFE
jgi:hypothetical protein